MIRLGISLKNDFLDDLKLLLLRMNRVYHFDLQLVVRVYAESRIVYVELPNVGSVKFQLLLVFLWSSVELQSLKLTKDWHVPTAHSPQLK